MATTNDENVTETVPSWKVNWKVEDHERTEKRKSKAKYVREMCLSCNTPGSDVMRWFILPCGHHYCTNCVCDLFGLFDEEKHSSSPSRISSDLRMLVDVATVEKPCPCCKCVSPFDELILQEIFVVNSFSELITINIRQEDDPFLIRNIIVRKEEPRLIISLLFFFKICKAVVNSYRIDAYKFGERLCAKNSPLCPCVGLSDDDIIDLMCRFVY